MSASPLIAQARRSRGKTQVNLALEIGVSIPTIRALERGEGNLRALGRAMKALGALLCHFKGLLHKASLGCPDFQGKTAGAKRA